MRYKIFRFDNIYIRYMGAEGSIDLFLARGHAVSTKIVSSNFNARPH